MFGNSIRKTVLSKVNRLIEAKEKEFNAGKKKLAEVALVQMEAVKRENEAKTAELKAKCVNDILGKII